MSRFIQGSGWYRTPNRDLCNVLDELRTQIELNPNINTTNGHTLLMMVEEARHHASKMEAVLEDWSDIRTLQKERSELRQELEALEKELESKKSKED